MTSAVPSTVKNIPTTPKKPTKNGPTQKSNRSPPSRVPPRTRYFLSKLNIAIGVSDRSRFGANLFAVKKPVTDEATCLADASSVTVVGHGYFAAGGKGAI